MRSSGSRPALGHDLVQVLGDRQRVPDLRALVRQARHADRRREQQQLLPRVGVVGRDHHLVELEARRSAPSASRAATTTSSSCSTASARRAVAGSAPRALRRCGGGLGGLGCDGRGDGWHRRLAAGRPHATQSTVPRARPIARWRASCCEHSIVTTTPQRHDVRRLPGPGRRCCGRCAPSAAPSVPMLLDAGFGAAPARGAPPGRRLARLLALAEVTHARPPWGIASVVVDGERVPVVEEVAAATPFATLRRFRKVGAPRAAASVLVVAPMSGHFATLLRDTVRTLLRDHDVYVTDWHNVRDVPLARRPLRPRRVHRAHDRLHSPRSGPGAQRDRDLPAVRRRARRGRADVGGRAPGARRRA